MATNPATYFIRIYLPKLLQPLEVICLDNDKTKERLLTEMIEVNPNGDVLEISRYPFASNKENLIVTKEEVFQKRIYLSKELKVVAI
jgi:hypothetical protein